MSDERQIGFQRTCDLVEKSGIKGAKAILKFLDQNNFQIHQLSALEDDLLNKLGKKQSECEILKHNNVVMVEVLKSIANQDFRGNRPYEQVLAFNALAKLKPHTGAGNDQSG